VCVALPAQAEWKRLFADHAEASSFLKSNWNKFEENYHPSYVLDDDPKTAWVEGVTGDGVGQQLTIPVSALGSARAVKVVIFNGYQKSKALLVANGAPKAITLTTHAGRLQTGSASVSLERKLGPQTFEVPVTGGLSAVTLTITAVHPGATYQDTCISDVQIFVDSEVPYVATVENAKRGALLAWRKERLARATIFAKLPPAYAYVGPSFTESGEDEQLESRCVEPIAERDDGRGCVAKKSWVPLQQRLARGLPGWSPDDLKLLAELTSLAKAPATVGVGWYSLTPPTKQLPAPEGIPLDPLLEPLLHLHDATLFEARGAAGRTVSSHENTTRSTLSNLRLLEGTSDHPRRAFFTFRRVEEERTVWTEDSTWLATWDDAGQLAALVSESSSGDDLGRVHTVTAWHVTLHEGRIAKVTRTQTTDAEPHFVEEFSGLLSQHRVYQP
jgi:hypothetical protein